MINGTGGLMSPGRLVCHVLLIEAGDGLVLVDTGFGLEDVDDPRRLTRQFTLMTRPRLQRSETAIEQVRALGLDPADVRHIIVTHLDVDHTGGLPDFPAADVHLFAREHQTMLRPPLRERMRYHTGSAHWRHGPRWQLHEVSGERWLGFESVRLLPGTDAEIVMVPLLGHSLGHTGVALRRGDGWLLHCGDAFFHRDEVSTPPGCPPGLRAFQVLVQADGRKRRQNQERLRELAREHSEVELICSHDPVQLDRATAPTPAPA
jgi:glyoxylase-like metal-dependent hydrolase (beta-lactamase superfamily II)